MSKKSIAAILEESGIEQQSKRQRVEETVSDLIASAAEKAASCAADAAIAKCNAIWQAKIDDLCARCDGKTDVKTEAPQASTANAGSSAQVPTAAKEQPKKSAKSACDCAHEACMLSAAASALVGIRLEHGGPFGASVVRDGVIISCAHNMVLTNQDPTCHAEMTAIRQACKALGTHDLSDCELYTTCEPCPMCWGAIQWSRLGKAYLGVDRHTAAKYGFDDKVFYDEIDGKSGVYGWKRFGFLKDSCGADLSIEKEMVEKNMVEIYDGVLREECEKLFTNPALNRTLRVRYGPGTELIHQAVKEAFPDVGIKRPATLEGSPQTSLGQHENFMRKAVAAAEKHAKCGMSKEREPFAAIIVKDGLVIATACNSVISSRDCTASAEVNAIQAASTNLGTHNLEGCEMYTTVQPDVMSLGAILWSRMSRVYCGVTQQFAAQYGFEHGTLHFKDLLSGTRGVPVEQGVALEECEAVFKEWSDRNGVIY